MAQAEKFCRCIKSVKKTVKLRKGQKKTPTAKEQAAIAICTTTMLQRRGRTLRKFKCRGKKPMLETQAKH